MVSIDTFRQMVLSFSDVTEQPHFDKQAFKVKKIFATLDVKNKRACLMLSQLDQSVFCAFDLSIVYPVPNKWGKNGATFVELKTVSKDLLKDALTQAYEKCVANKSTAPRDNKIEAFLSDYDEKVFENALKLRKVLFANLPEVTEQLDLPAKMIAYCYGQRYVDMICTVIPSKKGLKLGFYKGNELPDPAGLLEGTGKISRYIEIRSDKEINSAVLKKLIGNALKAYKERIKKVS